MFKFCPMCGSPLKDGDDGLICSNTCDVTWVSEHGPLPGEGYWGSFTWVIVGKVWGVA